MTFTAGTSFPISFPITELDDEEGVVEQNRSFTATSQGDRDDFSATDGGEFSYELPYKQELLSISEFNYKLEEEDINFALLNLTMHPCPTLEDYVNTIKKVGNYQRTIFSLPTGLIMLIAYITQFILGPFVKNNPFECPTRRHKLRLFIIEKQTGI